MTASSPKSWDTSIRAVVHPPLMAWIESPDSRVWRRRLSLEGEVESGRVTSMVKFGKGAVFHKHAHPDGEEIFVLEGSLRDANGIYPKGTYMLNPDGSVHQPSSPDGCILFVKLRQYGGQNRQYMCLETETMHWKPSENPAIQVKHLYKDPLGLHIETTRIEKWASGRTIEYCSKHLLEVLVLEGKAVVDGEKLEKYSWICIPVCNVVQFYTDESVGTEVFIKEGEWRPKAEDHDDA
eukprot:509025_1